MEMKALDLSKPSADEEFEVLEDESVVDTDGKDELDVTVVDDTPDEDRDRKAGDPPEDVTEDELKDYSDKVAKRIKRFSKGYHDERRAKESAFREREAMENYARQLVEENRKLKQSQDMAHNTLVEHGKKQVETELEMARRKYKDAYDSGDTDALLEAQESLNRAQIRAEKITNIKPRALQDVENPVKDVPKQVSQPTVDQKAQAWQTKNTWFGQDTEMTAYALGYHTKLTREQGVDPSSDEYYEKLNSRMREKFPEEFDEQESIDDDGEGGKPRARRASVVAPATRSTAPKKVVLTKSEVAIAGRLGVPLEEYAKQVALLRRKS